MLFQAWRVPVVGGDAVLRELNAFALKHRILELQRGYDAAAGILAHADSREWRRRQLRLSPPDAECEAC